MAGIFENENGFCGESVGDRALSMFFSAHENTPSYFLSGY